MAKEKSNSNSSDITTIVTIWLFLPKTVRIFEKFRIEEVCSTLRTQKLAPFESK